MEEGHLDEGAHDGRALGGGATKGAHDGGSCGGGGDTMEKHVEEGDTVERHVMQKQMVPVLSKSRHEGTRLSSVLTVHEGTYCT
jgi:hypothetical protein